MTESILNEIAAERAKQDAKWGLQEHGEFKWVAILGEEFGEVSKATLENDREGYRAELVQVAAVAVAMIECLDRKVARNSQ